ncbi:MAG: TlpA family protein disulfide reductase [Bryobacterales bacterium]|nr:TlpA family protein disulfide reductase [Bryobacterales bacterium]
MINRRTFVGLGAGAALGSLDLSAQMKTGKPAPELVISLNSGEQLLLSKLKGKVVVLEVLLTTCPHCQKCSATMQKLYAEMRGAFQPVGTAINPDDMGQARMMIPQYVSSLGLKFPVGWTPREMVYKWLDADTNKGPIYFPQVVVIDKAGIVRSHHPATDQKFFENEEAHLREEISLLIGAPAGARKGS